jgi:hypothetical protein
VEHCVVYARSVPLTNNRQKGGRLSMSNQNEEKARQTLSGVRQALESLAIRWARLEVPGDVMEAGYLGQKTLFFGESPDGNRAARSYNMDVYVSRARCSLPGVDERTLECELEGNHSLNDLLERARLELVRDWRYELKRGRDATEHTLGEASPEYRQALRDEWKDIKDDVYNLRIGIVLERWEHWRALESARLAWEDALEEAKEIEDLARASFLWGALEEGAPRAPHRRESETADDISLDVDRLYRRMDEWEKEMEARARAQGVRLVRPCERTSVSAEGVPAQWFLFGVKAEAVAKALGVPEGVGIGLKEAGSHRYVPGADPVVVLEAPTGGAKRYSVEVSKSTGLEQLKLPLSAQGRRSQVLSYRVTATDWCLVWHQIRDGRESVGTNSADSRGVHEDCRTTDWDGVEEERKPQVQQAVYSSSVTPRSTPTSNPFEGLRELMKKG